MPREGSSKHLFSTVLLLQVVGVGFWGSPLQTGHDLLKNYLNLESIVLEMRLASLPEITD